jgi:hypothetical protein
MNIPKVKKIPVPNVDHPEPKYPVLPKHEFTIGLIAPKGAGKTTTMINLLDFYKGYFHNIIVFSPTVASDEKWDYAKKQDYLVENKELKNWIRNMSSKVKKDSVVEGNNAKSEFEELVDLDTSFDPKIPVDHFLEDYSESTLRDIYSEQMKLVQLLKKHGKTKHLANRLLIIFDDLVGSALFSNAKENVFKGFFCRHRHYSCSMLMVSQGYKEIPKTVRTNFTCLILFEICSEGELEVICEEFPMGIKKDDQMKQKDRWLQVYEYAIKEPHHFLFYNMQEKDKRKRIMKNFEEYLFIDE